MERTLDSVAALGGFRYTPGFVSVDEESEFLDLVKSMPFRTIEMRGEVARRTVTCFGFDYLYSAQGVAPAEPFPPLLLRLCERAETLAGDGSMLRQAIVTCYPPGAGINWHVDAPVFGPSIVGVSFGNSARLHLRQASNVHRMIIAPRSAYVLSGAARREWAHRVSPVRAQRYSVTFRSLALPGRAL